MNDTSPEHLTRLMSSVPVDIPALVTAMGIAYRERDDGNAPVSAIVYDKSASPHATIEVRSDLDQLRKRSAVAWELARWILAHPKITEDRRTRRLSAPPPVRRFETRIGRPQGAIDPDTGVETERLRSVMLRTLMPDRALRESHGRLNGDWGLIAQEFLVSEPAARLRGIALKL